jgi:hypothetical protein
MSRKLGIVSRREVGGLKDCKAAHSVNEAIKTCGTYVCLALDQVKGKQLTTFSGVPDGLDRQQGSGRGDLGAALVNACPVSILAGTDAL